MFQQIYVAIESRKREVLDKHLDMIVGQTERFSKMLAQVGHHTGKPLHD
jgi:hypothetical protein